MHKITFYDMFRQEMTITVKYSYHFYVLLLSHREETHEGPTWPFP